MAVDPTQVHPEHPRPTPENIEEWSDDQLDAYREAKQRELNAEADERRAELSAKERKTVEALRSAVSGDESEHTETVDIGGAEVVVTTKLSGRLERMFTRISNTNELDEMSEVLIDTILELIVDDDESGTFDFQSREVWQSYYDSEGSEGLYEVFQIVADPALERRERLGNSQDRTRRSQSSTS